MVIFASAGVCLAVFALMLHIMWIDFTTLKIKNAAVMALLFLYVPFGALHGFSHLTGDMFSGALLFAIGVTFWLLGMMGAGDAKLFAAVGPFVGFDHLAHFVMALLGVSLLFLLVLVIAERSGHPGRLALRLREIKQTGNAPYGVVICLAAFLAIGMRLGSALSAL